MSEVIKQLMDTAKNQNSEEILITNVTHAAVAKDKKLQKNKRGEWYEIKGDYIYEFKDLNYEVKATIPGTYKLVPKNYGFKVVKQTLLIDKMFKKLETLNLVDSINTFLSGTEKLKSYGVGLVKRGILLHGGPGVGKTAQINNTVNQIIGENGVSFSFSMSQADIGQLVDHLQENPPAQNVDKLIVIIEDLGGGEMPDQGYKLMASQDELLAFLDGNNIPDTWRHLPIVIFSTTNYPGLFLANLVDRPGRFDDVIEVQYPNPDLLVEYAETFMGEELTEFDKREILKGSISIAHVKEACIKKLVYNDQVHVTIKRMREWSEKVKKNLEKKEAD